jgi:hypothetical protein
MTAFCPTHAQCNAKVRANGRQQQAADGPFLVLMAWRGPLPFFFEGSRGTKKKKCETNIIIIIKSSSK